MRWSALDAASATLSARATEFPEFLAVIGRPNLNSATHFIQAGANALAHSIGERFFFERPKRFTGGKFDVSNGRRWLRI
jgi:hypothetical protein